MNLVLVKVRHQPSLFKMLHIESGLFSLYSLVLHHSLLLIVHRNHAFKVFLVYIFTKTGKKNQPIKPIIKKFIYCLPPHVCNYDAGYTSLFQQPKKKKRSSQLKVQLHRESSNNQPIRCKRVELHILDFCTRLKF